MFRFGQRTHCHIFRAAYDDATVAFVLLIDLHIFFLNFLTEERFFGPCVNACFVYWATHLAQFRKPINFTSVLHWSLWGITCHRQVIYCNVKVYCPSSGHMVTLLIIRTKLLLFQIDLLRRVVNVRTIEVPHQACFLEAHFCLKVHNVHLSLSS